MSTQFTPLPAQGNVMQDELSTPNEFQRSQGFMDGTSSQEITAAYHPAAALAGKRLALIVGAEIGPLRRIEASQGKKPRIDVIEMESQLGASLYDLGWLCQRVRMELLTRILFRLLQRFLGWSWVLALRVLWETRNADAIYASGEDVGLPLAVLLCLLRRRKPYLVMRMEQLAYGRSPLRRSLFLSYTRFALKRVDTVLCRTRAHARTLVVDLGMDAAKVRFVPEPTDPAFFSPATAGSTNDRQIVPTEPYILSAGLEMRDYPTLIEAVRGIPVQVVIGAGSPWSKFGFAADHVPDLPENVHIAAFTPAQMRELYRRAALIVVSVRPTQRACGMNVVLEAWAMERPVIASRTDGLVSYIEDGRTGIFVSPGDSQAIRMQIGHLLERSEESCRLGTAGRVNVCEQSNLDSYVQTVAEIISEVFARNE